MLPAAFDPQAWTVHNALLIGGEDTDNGTVVPDLVGGAIFPGVWREISDYAELVLTTASDVASAVGGLQVQWSHDGGVTEDTMLRDTYSIAATALATPWRFVFARKARHYRVVYANGAAPQTRMWLNVCLSALPAIGGGIGSAVNSAGAPGTGVHTALANNNSTLVATVQVGYRYRLSIIDGTGTAVNCVTGTAAARATDEIWFDGQKFEFTAVVAGIYAQKYVVGSANSTVVVVPLDGGTIV